ncbi:MAG: glycosyltransferase family 2 protein [Myxococcales bacterium]|nr:glycosyltransferase family 2 protein [Myxococcales bacterium]
MLTASMTPDADVPRPHLSVVIPIYRGEPFIVELHERLTRSLMEIHPDYEIIFVDDCSVDDSWNLLRDIQSRDPKVRLVQLTRNYGQQRAVLCGFEHARGDYVITTDEDLQHRPEEIRLLYDEICRSDLDIVMGSFAKKRHGAIRGLGTWTVKRLANLTLGVPTNLDLTSFRIIRRATIAEVMKLRNTNPVVGFLLFHVTHRIRNVVVHHDPRRGGGSSYTFRGLVRYFLCMAVDYSDLPLRAVGYFGVGASVLSLLLGIWYLQLFFRGHLGVAGFPTIVLLILLFSGLILMSLGVIGAYLKRILSATNVDRMYSVRERIGFRHGD